MARTTRRDIPGGKGAGQPPSATDTRTSGAAPKDERTHREYDTQVRTALDWERFETWCKSNGMDLPPSSHDVVAWIAAYLTFLAATGRSIAVIAKSLIRARQKAE
jgi:hypothetical protein